jgi:hypothetical protein
MTDRATKERKLIALMLTDLELDLTEPEMVEVQQEVGELPDEELKRTLASRLNLPYPVDDQAMEQVLSRIEEPESFHGGQLDSVAGTADAGHGSRSPGERRD